MPQYLPNGIQIAPYQPNAPGAAVAGGGLGIWLHRARESGCVHFGIKLQLLTNAFSLEVNRIPNT